MAIVGQVLANPESGWKRIDDAHLKILKSGDVTSLSGLNGYWEGTRTSMIGTNSNSNYLEFVFSGVMLRIIGDTATSASSSADSSITIEIDGVKSTFTNISNGVYKTALLYEKIIYL